VEVAPLHVVWGGAYFIEKSPISFLMIKD